MKRLNDNVKQMIDSLDTIVNHVHNRLAIKKKSKDDAKNIPRNHTTIFGFGPLKIYYLSAITSRTKKEASAASDYSEKKHRPSLIIRKFER